MGNNHSASEEIFFFARSGNKLRADSLSNGCEIEEGFLDGGFRQDLVALLPRLRRFARGLCGSVEDADDLVQAACERAILKADQWRPGSRLDSWMYRMIQTIHIDGLRSDKVRSRHRDMAGAQVVNDNDGRRHTEARLTLQEVRGRILDLPEDQRAVLLLTCVEGMTYKEAAETLGVPTGTVMSRLSRARGALAAAAGGVDDPGTTGGNIRGAAVDVGADP